MQFRQLWLPKRHLLFWLVAIAGVGLDQLSKYWLIQVFETPGTTWPLLTGIFHFTYVHNTGAAFSVFRGGVGWLKWLSLVVSVALVLFVWKTPKLLRLEQFAYGCILAGALGNGIDRFRLGYVVDFLDFRLINFPVFNFADVLINLGIIALLITTLPRRSPTSPPH